MLEQVIKSVFPRTHRRAHDIQETGPLQSYARADAAGILDLMALNLLPGNPIPGSGFPLLLGTNVPRRKRPGRGKQNSASKLTTDWLTKCDFRAFGQKKRVASVAFGAGQRHYSGAFERGFLGYILNVDN